MQDNSQSENNFEDQNDIEIPYIIRELAIQGK